MLREVVAEVKAAKGYDDEGVALTEVLDAVHLKFPPAKLAELSETEAVEHMQHVLKEIRAELAAVKTAEKEAPEQATEEEGTTQTAETAAKAATATSGMSKEDDRAKDAENAPPTGSKTITLTDLASLAGATVAPPAVTLREAAAAERREADARAADEQKRKKTEAEARREDQEAKEAEKKKKKEAVPGSVDSTLSALDRLTTAVSEKLEREKQGNGK